MAINKIPIDKFIRKIILAEHGRIFRINILLQFINCCTEALPFHYKLPVCRCADTTSTQRISMSCEQRQIIHRRDWAQSGNTRSTRGKKAASGNCSSALRSAVAAAERGRLHPRLPIYRLPPVPSYNWLNLPALQKQFVAAEFNSVNP